VQGGRAHEERIACIPLEKRALTESAMSKTELSSAIEESITAVKNEIAGLKEQAKRRMHDREAIHVLTRSLRALTVRLEKLERNLHRGT
jgi:hypothetical protein